MRVIDSILDFPKGDWGEDRLFIGDKSIGVIDGATPISATPLKGYHSQAKWLADKLAKGLKTCPFVFIPHACMCITDSLCEDKDFLNLNLTKENYPSATFAGISQFYGRTTAFVLSDCAVVFEMNDGTLEVVTDNRIKKFSSKTIEVRKRAYRALRKNGNRRAIVIDHGDNAFVHGMLDDIKNYSLTESEDKKQREEREKVFDRAGSNWAFDEVLGVELEEVYRYGKGYDSKYDKLVEKANSLANMDGFMLLIQVQTELKIVSAPGQPAWAYAYALSKGIRVFQS